MDCSLAEEFWTLNEEVAAERAANSPAEAGVEARGPQQGNGRAGNGGGRRGGAQASASSLRGSYSAPDSPGGSSLASADSGYGAPPLTGYGARRRNARGLEEAGDDGQDYEY